MKYKKILLTGAAGFIGFYTVKKLMSLGHTVVGIDNINDYYDVNLKYARLQELGIERTGAEVFHKVANSSVYEDFSFIRLNLEDREAMQSLFEKEQFDAVIHLAAQAGVRYSLENPEAYIDSNIVGFLTILEGCRHSNVQHLVYASSSSVYGENEKVPFEETDRVDYPVSLYAATKKSNELMAHTYSHLYEIPTSGLRFFTVYGPWGRPDMAPMLFANAITNNKPIKVFNHGEMYRDFTFIEDIVEGIVITLNNPPNAYASTEATRLGAEVTRSTSSPSQIFNIGNGSPVHLTKFIEVMEEKLGKVAEKNMMGMQAGDVPRTWANTEALEKLGYKSTTNIEKGVEEFVKWFNKFYK